MNRFDFRLKLDLYKYYQDARRFCWVFVDGTKMLDIAHLKRHITRLLSIEEPFYLLLNDHEYLPPNEDIRILQENERVLVVPGTGLEQPAVSLEANLSKDDSLSEKKEGTTTLVERENIQAKNYPVREPSPKEHLSQAVKQDDVSSCPLDEYQPDVTGSSSFHTLQEETEAESTKYKTITESDTIEDSSTLDILVPIPKRKKVRKRKQRTKVRNLEEPKKNYSAPPNKLKIINTCTIPSGKHIRFINTDNDETVANTEAPLPPASTNGICRSDIQHEKLSALLSLGNNSTPLIFTSRNSKMSSTEETSDSKVLSTSANSTPEKLKTALFKDHSIPQSIIENSTELDVCDYPLLTAKIHDNDIIAFKMLKMGADYTPQVSNYIVAQVLSSPSGELSKYNFKILRGVEEIETPVGKFTMEDENGQCTNSDIIMLNYTDLIQPRLLHTANSTLRTEAQPLS